MRTFLAMALVLYAFAPCGAAAQTPPRANDEPPKAQDRLDIRIETDEYVLAIVPDDRDFDSLPRRPFLPEVHTMQDLRGAVLRFGADQDRHLVSEIAYVRRGDDVLLSAYSALSDAGQLHDYRLKADPRDQPVERLDERDSNRTFSIVLSHAPALSDPLLADATFQDQVLEAIADPRALREASQQWTAARGEIEVKVDSLSYYLSPAGELGIRRFEASAHVSEHVRVRFTGDRAPGGDLAALAIQKCPLTPVDICVGGFCFAGVCMPPACACTGFDCTLQTPLKCIADANCPLFTCKTAVIQKSASVTTGASAEVSVGPKMLTPGASAGVQITIHYEFLCICS